MERMLCPAVHPPVDNSRLCCFSTEPLGPTSFSCGCQSLADKNSTESTSRTQNAQGQEEAEGTLSAAILALIGGDRLPI